MFTQCCSLDFKMRKLPSPFSVPSPVLVRKTPKVALKKVPLSGFSSKPIPKRALDYCLHSWLFWECSSEWRGRSLHPVPRRQRTHNQPCNQPIPHKLQCWSRSPENSSSPQWSQRSCFSQCGPPCRHIVHQTGTLTTMTYLLLLPPFAEAMQSSCSGFPPTATCLAMRLLTRWQNRAQQKSRRIGLPATLKWRSPSRPSNTTSGGTSTHSTTRLTPTTC